ncbi:uncharacterized protein [Hemitrygon akajei]|uniref:uncharacterized protein n=1 Tax=Hemitrygon akajei TaxID=2704970 RepID=UPI003BF9D5F6
MTHFRSPDCVSVNKMLWPLILLIGFLPVSGALSAKKNVRAVVGRAITIDCHYEEKYRSDTKYWCHGWTIQCSVLVETKGQHGRSGRVSITDNPERGIFTVTMEDLRSGDTGWYSCGIKTADTDPRFNLYLQVPDEPVSVPVLRYLSPANVSRLGGSVSVSCESSQGSLPIQYSWYEQTSSEHPTISDTNELTLRCQSFNHQHHQYYCKASNRLGARSSTMVNVTVFNNRGICSYVTEINGTKGSPDLGDELGAPVRNDVRGNSMKAEDMLDKEVSSFTGRREFGKGFGKTVHHGTVDKSWGSEADKVAVTTTGGGADCRQAERQNELQLTIFSVDQSMEIKESKLSELSLIVNSSFTRTQSPFRKNPRSDLSFYPESAANVRNSTEYSATLREP